MASLITVAADWFFRGGVAGEGERFWNEKLNAAKLREVEFAVDKIGDELE